MSAAAQAVRAKAASDARPAAETKRAPAEAQLTGSPRYLRASVRLGGLHDPEEHEAEHAAGVIAAGGRYQVRDPGGSCHLRAADSGSTPAGMQRRDAAGVRAAVTPPVQDPGADGRIKRAPMSQPPVTQPVIAGRTVDLGGSGRIRSAPIADPGGAAHLRAMHAPETVRGAAWEMAHLVSGRADARAGERVEKARSATPRPMPATVRARLEHGFGESMESVRLHTGPEARAAAGAIGARAYTEGERITLGHGESEHDLRLMAHEATHVVQNRRAAGIVRPLDAAAPDKARGDVAAAAKVEHGPVRPIVRRSALSRALDWIADKANFIPGFRLFTIILGVNPINMSKVDRSGANILRAAISLMPLGELIVRALDQYGAFDKAGAFVDQQIKSLAMTGAAIRDALMDFLDSLSWTDIFHPGDVWDRAKRIFTDPIDRIKNFFVGLAEGLIQFVKDAVLKPLAALAAKTPAWDILVGVLGKNPITKEEAPPAGEALIGGLLKLAHQDEIYENMKKSRALARIGAWFKGVVSQLLAFVLEIPSLFISALKSFKISDLLDLPGAFARVVGIFGKFVVKFVNWVGNAIWTMLEIIFDVVSPQALTYIKKTGAALKSIFKNPLPFVGNLVKAAKLGFTNFADNIIEHLKAGLIDWLTGSLPGVYIPQALSLVEFGKFALSVLGVTWGQIRGKIVKALGPTGETIMKALETTFDVVVKLVQGGFPAAWEFIKEKLSDLKDTLIGGIVDFVKDSIITKAVPKLISMFIPGAGFISAIISIYDTIKVFIEKLSKIGQVVLAFVDSIVAIAAGQITGAAKRVETSLAGLLSLAISFLAGFVSLGGVADKVRGVIKKVQAAVDKAIETAVNWVIGKAKALFAKLFGGKDKDGKDDKADQTAAKPGDVQRPRIVVPFSLASESHELIIDPRGGAEPEIDMASGASLPFEKKQRDAYNGIEYFKQYMSTITDAQVRREFETKLMPEIARFQVSNIEAWKALYRAKFPSDVSDAEARARAETVKNDAERLLASLKSWGATSGIPDLSKDAVNDTLVTKGQTIWKEAWEKRRQQVIAALAAVTYKGIELQRRGSIEKGYRGPQKNQVRFNPDDFDVDLYVVHLADYQAALAAFADVKGDQIFPNDPAAPAALRQVSKAATAALTQALPDIGRLKDTTVSLRGAPKS
jgi:Domain of unknown function (DUF4157)